MLAASQGGSSMVDFSHLIQPAVLRYRRERDRYVKLADRVAEICREDVCEQNAIRAQVTYRVKSEKSFEGKLKRFNSLKSKAYSSVDNIFEKISDFSGVRIATYRSEDCEKVVEHLIREFSIPINSKEIDRKDKKTPDNQNYYRAIHVQVVLPEDQQIGIYDNVGDISCEIQVCTMIAHVWNEVEHDIGYKSELSEPSLDEKYYLSQLGRTVRQGDLEISSLLAAHERRIQTIPADQESNIGDQRFLDVHDFVTRTRDIFNGSITNFAENSGQLFHLLVDIDIASPGALKESLRNLDFDTIRKYIEEFNNYLNKSGVEGLRLDENSSDLILVALLENKSKAIVDELRGRAGRGVGRPSRLHRIAVRYRDWRQTEG